MFEKEVIDRGIVLLDGKNVAITYKGERIILSTWASQLLHISDIKKVYYSRQASAAGLLIHEKLVELGVPAKGVLQRDCYKITKEKLYKDMRLVPVVSKNTGLIHFLCPNTKEIQAFCPKHFRKLMNFTRNSQIFQNSLELEIIHDETLEEGLIGEDKINCTTYAPWVFD